MSMILLKKRNSIFFLQLSLGMARTSLFAMLLGRYFRSSSASNVQSRRNIHNVRTNSKHETTQKNRSGKYESTKKYLAQESRIPVSKMVREMPSLNQKMWPTFAIGKMPIELAPGLRKALLDGNPKLIPMSGKDRLIIHVEDEHYTTVPDPDKINFEKFPSFTSAFNDLTLHKRAREAKAQLVGSSSSVSPLLSHLVLVLLHHADPQLEEFGEKFKSMPSGYTGQTRKPIVMAFRRCDDVWSINAHPARTVNENEILIKLGQVMETLFTRTPDDFETLRTTYQPNADQEHVELDFTHECHSYMHFGDLYIRAQLDCSDSLLPKRNKIFDIKTRATLPIRLDPMQHTDYTSYKLTMKKGILNSFEREFFDMCRSAFIKYSLQCRAGNMYGVLVAYHNTQSVFGFQMIPLSTMEHIIYGNSHTAKRAFMFALQLMELISKQIINRARIISGGDDCNHAIRVTVAFVHKHSLRIYAELPRLSNEHGQVDQEELPWHARHSSLLLARTLDKGEAIKRLHDANQAVNENLSHAKLVSQLEGFIADRFAAREISLELLKSLVRTSHLFAFDLSIHSIINGFETPLTEPLKILKDDQWDVKYNIRPVEILEDDEDIFVQEYVRHLKNADVVLDVPETEDLLADGISVPYPIAHDKEQEVVDATNAPLDSSAPLDRNIAARVHRKYTSRMRAAQHVLRNSKILETAMKRRQHAEQQQENVRQK